MKITNRLYTYPVLSDEKDDYICSHYNVNFSYRQVGLNILKLNFKFDLICEEIEKKIKQGQAEYLIHIECSTTAYRETLRSRVNFAEKEILLEKLNGRVEIVAFIIASKDIFGFNCSDWVEDYEQMSFDLPKGSILAYKNLNDLNIVKDFEEFSNSSSLFLVYKKISDCDKPIDVDMESHKIKIGLGTNEYDTYVKFFKRQEIQSVLNSMIILPVLVYVFEELRQEGGVERYSGRRWFIALENSYRKKGVDLRDEILNDERKSIELAQEAMQLPISKALSQISSFYDQEGED